MGRPVGELSAADYHATKRDLRAGRARRARRPATPLRRGDLRGRRQPGRDQPARPTTSSTCPWPTPPGCRPSSSATSTGAACSPRSTAPSTLLPDAPAAAACAASSSTGSGATPPSSVTPAPSSSGAAAFRPSAWCPTSPALDLDAEDSLALDRLRRRAAVRSGAASTCSTWPRSACPRVANFGDLDPLRLEPDVRGPLGAIGSRPGPPRPGRAARARRTPASDLAWFRSTGLADAVEPSRWRTAVVAVCAGAQMLGGRIDDPGGVEGPAGTDTGLGWLPLATTFRWRQGAGPPTGLAVAGPVPGSGSPATASTTVAWDRSSGAVAWLVADGGEVLGWHAGGVCGTTLHGLLEDDGFRAAALRWAADRSGKRWRPGEARFAGGPVRTVRSHRCRHRDACRPRSPRWPHRGGRNPTSLSTTPLLPAK